MLEGEYQCYNCGTVFVEGNEQEALAETEIVFGEEIPVKDRARICGDCYKKFMEWYEVARRRGEL